MSWLDKFFTSGYKNIAIAGVVVAQEATLNFASGATAVDNAAAGRTDVTIPSGTLSAYGGDLSNTSTATNQYVQSLSFSSAAGGGAIAINGTGTTFLIAAGNTGFSISQSSTSSATAANLTLAPQASTATNGTPGNLVVNIAAPTGSGTRSYALFQEAATNYAALGRAFGGGGIGALFLGSSIAPSASNYALQCDGTTNTTLNAPGAAGSILLALANSTQIQVGANGALTINAGVTTAPSWTQAAVGGTGALAGLNWTFQAQNGQNVASGSNNAGGNLVLLGSSPGSGGTAGTGNPGLIVANLQTPGASATRAFFQVQEGGTIWANVGQWTGTGYGALYLGTSAGAPGNNNYTLIGRGDVTQLNGTTTVVFAVNSANYSYYTANGFQLFSSTPSFGSGTGILGITNASVACTTVPTGGCDVWHDSIGLHYSGPSTSFTDQMMSAVSQGSVNSQQGKLRKYSGFARTTTNAAVTILTIPLTVSATNAGFSVLCQGRDVSSGTVTDGVTFFTVFQFKNVTGTLSQGATTATQLKANDTSMASCTLTATFTSTNIQVQVTGLSSVTIDWTAMADVIIN